MERNKMGGASNIHTHLPRPLWITGGSEYLLQNLYSLSCDAVETIRYRQADTLIFCEGRGRQRDPLASRKTENLVAARGWGRMGTGLHIPGTLWAQSSSLLHFYKEFCHFKYPCSWMLPSAQSLLTFLCESLELWLQLPGRIQFLWGQKFIQLRKRIQNYKFGIKVNVY